MPDHSMGLVLELEEQKKKTRAKKRNLPGWSERHHKNLRHGS
jgi:hypothetical protein